MNASEPETARPSSGADDDSRRSFLTRLSLALSGLIGLALLVPGLGFLLAPLVRRPQSVWRPVGAVDRFAIGSTVLVSFEDADPLSWAGVTAESGAWLRRTAESEFIAFSINCRHLGCPVRWIEDARLFMCPCHGGVYYADGDVAGGPPPEALARIDVRIRNGTVELASDPLPLTIT